MGAIRGQHFKRRWRKSYPTSKLKSPSTPMVPKDLCCLHAAGSSRARLPGSTAVADSPRTGRTSIVKRSHSCASPQSTPSSESFVILPDVSGQTLIGTWEAVTFSACQSPRYGPARPAVPPSQPLATRATSYSPTPVSHQSYDQALSA
jgi:hypothetical protein